MNLNKFLYSVRDKLPEICSDKDLVKNLPDIFGSAPTIHRMRKKGQIPNHFVIEPFFYYLREDVISWIRSMYKNGSLEVN